MLLVSKAAFRLPGLAVNFYCPYILDVEVLFYEGPHMRAKKNEMRCSTYFVEFFFLDIVIPDIISTYSGALRQGVYLSLCHLVTAHEQTLY